MRQDTFTSVLVKDVALAFGDVVGDEVPDAARRALIRTAFAAIEGILWQLKTGLADRATITPRMFTAGEESLLFEETYEVDDDGEIRILQRFIPLLRNIRVTVRILQRVRPGYTPDFSNHGWAAFRKSLAVRNRLTHPKSYNDLQVSDDELTNALAAFHWFLTLAFEVDGESQKPQGLVPSGSGSSAP